MEKCKQCKKSLAKRGNIFCNRSCSASFHNKGVRRHGEEPSNCKMCHKKLKDSRRQYCSVKCQQELKYRRYIQAWKNGEEDGLIGKQKSVSGPIRRFLFEINDNKCQKCNWGEINRHTKKVPLQVHHKNGDYLNNKIENLELLCPNCHSLTDNFGSRNKNGRRANGHF
jgi:hypothetical protein